MRSHPIDILNFNWIELNLLSYERETFEQYNWKLIECISENGPAGMHFQTIIKWIMKKNGTFRRDSSEEKVYSSCLSLGVIAACDQLFWEALHSVRPSVNRPALSTVIYSSSSETISQRWHWASVPERLQKPTIHRTCHMTRVKIDHLWLQQCLASSSFPEKNS